MENRHLARSTRASIFYFYFSAAPPSESRCDATPSAVGNPWRAAICDSFSGTVKRWHTGCSCASAEGGTSKQSSNATLDEQSGLAGAVRSGRGYEPRQPTTHRLSRPASLESFKARIESFPGAGAVHQRSGTAHEADDFVCAAARTRSWVFGTPVSSRSRSALGDVLPD